MIATPFPKSEILDSKFEIEEGSGEQNSAYRPVLFVRHIVGHIVRHIVWRNAFQYFTGSDTKG